MPPRKRAAPAEAAVNGDHAPKRRSTRQAAAVSNKAGSPVTSTPPSTNTPKPATKKTPAAATESKKKSPAAQDVKEEEDTASVKPSKPAKTEGKKKGKPAASKQQKEQNADEATTTAPTTSSKRDAVTPDPDPDTIPAQNPDVVRHEGTWYWLLKAEPESRIEAGVDVRFSIDDLRARTKPEGWDGMDSRLA